MATRTLSNPTVQVNDDTIAIVPNSIEYKTGIKSCLIVHPKTKASQR